MDELKPCPFCGSKTAVVIELSAQQFKVFCDEGYCSVMTSIWGGRQPAIAAWNLRHAPSESEAVRALREQKDGAYSERNKLVAALSKLFPASLERHDDNDKTWEDDWRWIVFIDLPAGQASWHLHDSEVPNFAHLKRGQGRKWDGHTTDQKYERLAALPTPRQDEGAKP